MNGTVIKVFGKFYTVLSTETSEMLNCVLRGKLKQDKKLMGYSNPVAVGDKVDYDLSDDETGTINSVYERVNTFTRKDRGFDREDLIACNIDQVVIVQSFQDPEFNLRFVDRLFVRGEKEHIKVLLCVNKADLAEKGDRAYITDYYKNTHMETLFISAHNGTGIEELNARLSGKLSILVGYSGVGKSTILNALFPDLELRTCEVSTSTGKGKHTTTNVGMVFLKDNTRIIDTPGVREFGLMDIPPQELGGFFPDFLAHAHMCKFSPCTHDHEPKCEVKKQVEEGNISAERYVSYINILYSIKEYYENRW